MKTFLKIWFAAAIVIACIVIAPAAPKQYDITVPYDKPTAEQLESSLNYDLKPYAEQYLKAAEDNEINVYFLVAKDALESGWGRYPAAKNNLGGWTDENGNYMPFESKEEYIFYAAKKIKEYYLSADGKYYHGTTLTDVNVHYNGKKKWVTAVSEIWDSVESDVKKARLENENGARH